MRQFLVVLVVLIVSAASGPASAGFNQSRAWFEALSAEERTATQASLTLLGHYEYLVDGQFGLGTFEALTAFQRSRGHAATGVLLRGEQQSLIDQSSEIYEDLGMDVVRDLEGQAALIMPVSLLSERRAMTRGNAYATPDGGITLETTRRPMSETSFRALFDELAAPGADRVISYSVFNGQRFVVTGTESGRAFYAMFQNAEVDSVGYLLTWTDDYDPTARMLSIFIASHFTALRYMPLEGDDLKLVVSPPVTQQFGVFTLPADQPDVIMLNGEVTASLAGNFFQALEVRPDASILVLNSPGGYVDNALRVANEVRRRGMATLIAEGAGCYSACAYIFFAGSPRYVAGELGVHQISAEVEDLVMAQTTLSDVLDALDQFGVEQSIITLMLRTPPDEMYIFAPAEISELGINVGGPIRIAETMATGQESNVQTEATTDADIPPTPTAEPPVAQVTLSLQSTEYEANRSLQYARERWAGVLAGRAPEIHRHETPSGTRFEIRVLTRSAENANALCAAIKSAGGGCYVPKQQ